MQLAFFTRTFRVGEECLAHHTPFWPPRRGRRSFLCAAHAATAVQGLDLSPHATSSLASDARPVTKVVYLLMSKVVNLLKDMLMLVDKEAEEVDEIL